MTSSIWATAGTSHSVGPKLFLPTVLPGEPSLQLYNTPRPRPPSPNHPLPLPPRQPSDYSAHTFPPPCHFPPHQHPHPGSQISSDHVTAARGPSMAPWYLFIKF